MKAFNLKAEERNGKTLIALGEEGRGRKLTLVRCALDIKDTEEVTVIKPKPGVPTISKATPYGSTAWLARITTDGAYIRGAEGNVRFLGEGVELVAKGFGAFGDAGRTGNWDDVLIIVPNGTLLRVKPTRGDAYFLLFTAVEVVTMTVEEANF
jgi:hypothetical protein